MTSIEEIGMYIFVGSIFIWSFIDKKKQSKKSNEEKKQKKLKEIANAKREWEKQFNQKKQIEIQEAVIISEEKVHKLTPAPPKSTPVQKTKPPPKPRSAPEQIDFTQKLMEELGLTEPTPKTTEWNLELLMSLEWKRFEEVCKEFLNLKGHDARLTQIGADGGIDIQIYKDNRVSNLIQCKAWIWKVSVKEVRELCGIMASRKIENGTFFTTSTYTQEAIIFGQNNKILLVDGKSFIASIKKLTPQQQQQLLTFATAGGDYTTPTCPRCNQRMVKRNSRYGDFWGCANFPRCRYKQQMRRV